MDKALSPYVKGGGAKKYEEELRRMYGMDGSAQVSPTPAPLLCVHHHHHHHHLPFSPRLCRTQARSA